MAVASFDSKFSFRQEAVARIGDRANVPAMSATDKARFMNSPLMEKVRQVDTLALQKLSDRDKRRQQNDPGFKPVDADFEAPKAHNYDVQINYYTVLGVDEHCSQDQVKKAYRKMSLTYHPDKTTGMDQQQKDEYAAIFIEIKNAYKTLSDNPTRRQYDHDRDRGKVSAEVTGGRKPQDKASFDALSALRKLAEERAMEAMKRAPPRLVEVTVLARMEKFVFGGQKAVVRHRKVRSHDAIPITGKSYGYEEKPRTFRLDVPPGALHPFPVEFRRGGDQHEDRETDTIKFLLSAKQHEVVYRVGQDLHVRECLHLGDGWHTKPYLDAQLASVRGRHIMLWGRNPFFHCAEGAGYGELHIGIQGEGVGRDGALRFTARAGLTSDAQSKAGTRNLPGAAGRTARNHDFRDFLERHKLGPPGGLPAGSPRDVSGSAAMRRRLERLQAKAPTCELRLMPLGQPLQLYTRPPCAITFYGTAAQQSGPGPKALFAISISAPSCAKRRAAADWERLKGGLVPLLQATAFKLLQVGRYILPRALLHATRLPSTAVIQPCEAKLVPWKALGDRSLSEEDAWTAMKCYSHSLAQLLPSGSAQDGACDGVGDEAFRDVEDPDAVARVLSNRAACFAKCGDWAASQADATMATQLMPRWGRPWARLGLAARHLGNTQLSFQAYAKAVELDPTMANVKALQEAAAANEATNRDAAHGAKEQGNEALKAEHFGAAVSLYTVALARLPPAPTASDTAEPAEDRHALLRAVLLSNRSAAFCFLRCWEAAVADGRGSVAAMPHFGKGRCQLGTALLGRGLHEEAYVEFAKASAMDPESGKAKKGRNACLAECLLWRSTVAQARFNSRFQLDLFRPKHLTRVFAASAVHFDRGRNEEWGHAIDDSAFQNDVLIVAGDLADSHVAIRRGLTTLRSKFRRVFYTVGSHELAVHLSEFARYPDSIAKLFSIMELCDELGVDFTAAPVGEGLFVVPLFSWYNADFDEKDPFPDSSMKADQKCKWPMDPDVQVWKYMLNMNQASLERPLYGTIITFSNFLPRRDLPYDQGAKGAAKTVGCTAIDEQVRKLGSKLHVFGRSGRKHAKVHDGVRYVQYDVHSENEAAQRAAAMAESQGVANAPLMMVYDGRAVCSQEVGIDGAVCGGASTRLLHVEFWILSGCEEATLRKLRVLVAEKFNSIAGIKATFSEVGSEKKTKAALVKEVWPDLQRLGAPATHGLFVVADDLEAMRRWESCSARKVDWHALTAPFARRTSVGCVSVNSPLGIELVCLRKPDPVVLVIFLWLKPSITPDSNAYEALVAKVEAINKMPGVAGKLQASLQCSGFDSYRNRDLAEVLEAPDKSLSCTHVFTLFADEPQSIKALAQSKTFERYRTALAPHLQKMDFGQPEYGGVLPLKITASAAAPGKAKK